MLLPLPRLFRFQFAIGCDRVTPSGEFQLMDGASKERNERTKLLSRAMELRRLTWNGDSVAFRHINHVYQMFSRRNHLVAESWTGSSSCQSAPLISPLHMSVCRARSNQSLKKGRTSSNSGKPQSRQCFHSLEPSTTTQFQFDAVSLSSKQARTAGKDRVAAAEATGPSLQS